MTQAISGFFHTRTVAEAAQDNLLANGFTRDEISFVSGGATAHEIPVIGPVLSGTQSEAGRDAFVGAMAGMAAGLVALVIPGIGPLVAAGPLAGAIAGTGLGAAAGGLIGLLRDHGVSEEEAHFYAEGVTRGGALITIHGVEGGREEMARQILERNGAIKVEELAEGCRETQSSAHDRVRKAG